MSERLRQAAQAALESLEEMGDGDTTAAFILHAGLAEQDQLRDAAKMIADPVAWRLIETAPENLTVLVHYKTRSGTGRTMRARYYPPETLESDTTDSGWADEGWYEESEAYEYLMPLEGEPTHWMPLPPAPDDALAERDVREADFWKSVVESGKANMTPQPELVPSQTPQPVALLHTGAMFGGERDEYEFEVNGHERLERFCDQHPDQKIPLFAHPPRREWQGLTEPDIHAAYDWPVGWGYDKVREFAFAIEAALREKNA